MSPEWDEVRRWLEKAEQDRVVARLALEHDPPITDIVVFHAQQAVEKLLKAYLVYCLDPFEKVHDLAELIDRCVLHDGAFTDLRGQAAGLDPHAVRFRDSGQSDPSAEQARLALEVVADYAAFVTDRLPRQLREM